MPTKKKTLHVSDELFHRIASPGIAHDTLESPGTYSSDQLNSHGKAYEQCSEKRWKKKRCKTCEH